MSALARLWTLRGRRPVFVTVSLVVLGFFLAWPFVDWYLRTIEIASQVRFYDFGAYMGAFNRWQAGEPIYRQTTEDGYAGRYLYPPIALLLFIPFEEIPFYGAGLLWEEFSLVLLWLGLQLVLAEYELALRPFERGLLLWVLIGFQPLWFAFKHGQVAIFLAATVCFALATLERGAQRGSDGDSSGYVTDRSARLHRLASGALTTVAAAIKLTYLTAGAHLLRNWDRLLGAIAAGTVVVGISLVVFGVDTHLRYVDVLRWGIESGSTSRSPRLMTVAYYRPLYAIQEIATLVRGLGVVVIAGLALAATSGDADRETFALGVAAVPLLAPQSYTYTFVSLLPTVVVLLAVEFERDGRPLVPAVALLCLHVHAYGLMLFVDVLPRWVASGGALDSVLGLFQPGLWGNLLLIGLAVFRVAEHVSVPAWLSGQGSRIR